MFELESVTSEGSHDISELSKTQVQFLCVTLQFFCFPHPDVFVSLFLSEENKLFVVKMYHLVNADGFYRV